MADERLHRVENDQALHGDQTLWLRRALPIRVAIAVPFVIIVAALIGGAVGLQWWIGPIVGAALCLPLLVRVRGESVATKLSRRTRYATRSMFSGQPEYPEIPFDVPLPEGGSCGIRWENGTLITMLRLESPPQHMTKFVPGVAITDNTVPLDLLAESLVQFDVALESIDVISHGSRAYGTGDVARIYHSVLGPLPATAFRSVWIVLRLNPLDGSAAIARRGGGATGVLRTAMIATRRLAKRLTDNGTQALIMSAGEMNAATARLAEGHDLPAAEEHWDHISADRMKFTTFIAKPDGLETFLLTDVWTVPTLSTTISIRLRRNESDETAISALVRFNTLETATVPTPAGFTTLHGRQRDALLATLPLHDNFRDRAEFEKFGPAQLLREMAIPASGCGQLVGADEQGRAVTIPLVGASVREISIVGTLHLAQQVILRAIALGARVIVHTNRPGGWVPMAQALGIPQQLTIANFGGGGQQAGHRQEFSVMVFDGVPPIPHAAEVTMIRIFGSPTMTSGAPTASATVTLTQQTRGGPIVRIETAEGHTDVMMVATPDEMHYIGGSLRTPAPSGPASHPMRVPAPAGRR